MTAFIFLRSINMEEKFECPFTKEEAIEAINNLAKYFMDGKKDKDYLGLDDCGIIDLYLNFN